LTDNQALRERAEQLMEAICDHVQRTGSRRLGRDDVAPSIGIDTPIVDLTESDREFRTTARFEIISVTQAGLQVCEVEDV
jgi:predicted nucleotidyltransferase